MLLGMSTSNGDVINISHVLNNLLHYYDAKVFKSVDLCLKVYSLINNFAMSQSEYFIC